MSVFTTVSADSTTTLSVGSTSISSTTTANSVHLGLGLQQVKIPDKVDLNYWKTGKVWRYVIPQLLHNPDRKDCKNDDDQHCSDAVVWNVIYMTETFPFPSTSPPRHLVSKAKMYLRLLKTELNKVFYDETQRQYWKQANQQQWIKLRGDGEAFVNYRDLLRRTKDNKGELVSRTIIALVL